jgi:hypothetical protein
VTLKQNPGGCAAEDDGRAGVAAEDDGLSTTLRPWMKGQALRHDMPAREAHQPQP